MSTWRPKRCRDCPASVQRGDTISKQGYCVACGIRRTAEAITAMQTRDGELWERFAASPGPRGRPRSPKGVGGSSPPR